MLHRMNLRVEQFLATGARVILLLEPPSPHPGTVTQLLTNDQRQVDSNDIAYEQMNALLREVAAQHPHDVAVVNLGTRVCPSGPPCPYVVDGFGRTPSTMSQSIRPDELHYLPNASLWVARWLVPQIAAAAKHVS